MNLEIFSVILTGFATIATVFGVYLSLRGQYREIKADVSAANARIDATWSELLAITRQFKTTQSGDAAR